MTVSVAGKDEKNNPKQNEYIQLDFNYDNGKITLVEQKIIEQGIFKRRGTEKFTQGKWAVITEDTGLNEISKTFISDPRYYFYDTMVYSTSTEKGSLSGGIKEFEKTSFRVTVPYNKRIHKIRFLRQELDENGKFKGLKEISAHVIQIK